MSVIPPEATMLPAHLRFVLATDSGEQIVSVNVLVTPELLDEYADQALPVTQLRLSRQ